jgi:hypothetical protein
VIQPLSPETLWKQVVGRHWREATKTESRVLSLLLQGYRNDETAGIMGREPATVRRHISDLCDRAFAGTEIPRDREKLRLWGEAHQGCCVPLVKEMIENDRKTA